MDGNACENGFYLDFLSEWLQQRTNPQILFLTYEDMVEDLSREVKRICKFLEIDKSAEELEKIVSSSLFNSMSKNSFVNYTWRDGVVKDKNIKFLRKGKRYVCLSVSLSLSLYVSLYLSLSLCISVYLSLYLSLSLSLIVFPFLYPTFYEFPFTLFFFLRS